MSRSLSFPKALNEALHEEMERDPKVILLGEDVGRFGGMFRVTEGLFDRFGPKRVWDTPISEAGFLGMALGAALTGKRPVVELMFVDFSLVGMDQIVNQIAKTSYMCGGVPVPIVIRTQGGGYKGAAAQHSQMLEALFLHIPGLKVVSPSNPADAKSLLIAAIRDDSPVVFVEHKQLYGASGEVPAASSAQIGKASIARAGSDVTLVSYSYTLTLAREAAEALAKDGISVEVVDARTLNPLDFETIESSVRKTHRLVIAHEAAERCGFGSDLAFQIQAKLFDHLDSPVQVLANPNVPVPYAKNLELEALPSSEKIAAVVRRTL